MTAAPQSCDVAIIGAGMAGCTLALQLQAAQPGLSIAVFERNALPPPAAAHKVGESTVEIGSHYLAHTLQLEDLLKQTQLRKFGLRFFFDAGAGNDLAEADELGASDYFHTTSYQLDRGLLEASLASLMQQRGIAFQQQSRVLSVETAKNGGFHQFKVRSAETEQVWKCRWLIDAAGRASLLPRQLKLARKTMHKACAAWLRLDTAIDVDSWSDDPTWKARCQGQARRLSTNHLMGAGYWLWIIPLVGNRTSIGLVTDPEMQPLEQFNSLPRLLAWAKNHQPAMAERIAAEQSKLMDFHFLRDLSRDCRRTWSKEGWAMAGESGVFSDPFYSPGADYIGIGNCFITDLVTGTWNKAELQTRSALFNTLYRSFFSSTLSLYQHQYAGFGDVRLMAVKSTWDYVYYWSVLAWMFFRDVLTDLDFMQSCESSLRAMLDMNAQMQALFRARAARKLTLPGNGRFIDQKAIPILPQLNHALLEPVLPLAVELKQNCKQLAALMSPLQQMLSDRPGGPTPACSLLGDLAQRLR